MREWTDVCPPGDIAEGSYRVIEVDGVQVAVFNLAGEFYAIEDVCTHDGGVLTGGELDHGHVICPRHGARFCIRTGEALTPPAYEATACFPLRVMDGMLQVRDDRWD